MRKIITALALAAWATAAWAACTTHTYTQGGRTIICTTCCNNGNCNTFCT